MKLSHSTVQSDLEQGRKNSRTPSRPRSFGSFGKAAVLAASLAILPSACTPENHYYYTTVEAPPPAERPEETCPAPVASLSCRTPRINAVLEGGQNIRVKDRLVSFEGDADYDGQVVMKVTDRACSPISQGNAQIGEPYAVEGASDGITLTVLGAEAHSVEVELSLPLIVAGSLNQGEGLILTPGTPPQLLLQLDDLSTSPANEPPSALLSLIQNGNTIQHLDVQEGAAEPFGVNGARMSAGAPVVSPGYTFGANRAEIEVFRCDE